jgi:deoxyhypusine synthase
MIDIPDFAHLKTRSIKDRKSLVHIKDFAKSIKSSSKISDLWETIPKILAGSSLRKAVNAVINAYNANKPVILGAGAHLIKVGLSPLIIDLIKDKIIKGIALNGAGIIHDFEIAYQGETSEDVMEEIKHGTFGMTKETSEYINNAISEGFKKGTGIGESVGMMIHDSDFPHKDKSILAASIKYGIPLTVHIAIGTDITHISPHADGKAIGEGSFIDFKKFTSMISNLNGGGVFINVGSAVIIPEVFLKAVSAVRNLGCPFEDVTTIAFDFLHQYRTSQNIIKRPVDQTGQGIYLIGHHEIMIPLFYALIKEELAKSHE